MTETVNTVENELLKAKIEAQKKDKLVHLLAGLVVGLLVGFFGANWLNAQPAVGPQAAATATTSGELPSDHPPVEPGAEGDMPSSATAAAMPEVQAKIKAADDAPKSFEAQMDAAAMFHRIQNYERASFYLDRAYKLKPDDYDTLVNLATTTLFAGKFDDALPLFEKAKQQRPNDFDVLLGTGLTQVKLNQVDPAIVNMRAALAIDPKHEFTLQNLTEAYIRKGDAAGAETVLNQLTTINPQNHMVAHLREDLATLKTTGKIPTH